MTSPHSVTQRDVTERMRIEDELRVYREHIEKHAAELESQKHDPQEEIKVEGNFGEIVGARRRCSGCSSASRWSPPPTRRC